MYTLEQKQQFVKDLMEAIRRQPPCQVGDLVHIYARNGCYKVVGINRYGFDIIVKHKLTKLPWSNLKCLKGRGQSPEARFKRLVKELLK